MPFSDAFSSWLFFQKSFPLGKITKMFIGGKSVDVLVEDQTQNCANRHQILLQRSQNGFVEIIDISVQDVFDITRSRVVEQEVLDLLNESVSQ